MTRILNFFRLFFGLFREPPRDMDEDELWFWANR